MAAIRWPLRFEDVGLRDRPEVGGKDASRRLGESVAHGAADPDEHYVHRPTPLEGFLPVLQENPGSKEFRPAFEEEGSRPTRSVPVSAEERRRFVLSDEEGPTLPRRGARWRSSTPCTTACRPRSTWSGRRTATPTC